MQYGVGGGIRTLATSFKDPIPLAGEPLRPLEYAHIFFGSSWILLTLARKKNNLRFTNLKNLIIIRKL